MWRAGDRVGDFVLVSPLGTGGFASVWTARDVATSREVALKVLHDAFIRRPIVEKGPPVSQRFLAEARILQSLDHPGIVRIHAIIERVEEGIIAYAMERLVGRDLAQCQDDLELPRVVDVCASVADTLDFLHRRHVLHRDIKPSNIFITRESLRWCSIRERRACVGRAAGARHGWPSGCMADRRAASTARRGLLGAMTVTSRARGDAVRTRPHGPRTPEGYPTQPEAPGREYGREVTGDPHAQRGTGEKWRR